MTNGRLIGPGAGPCLQLTTVRLPAPEPDLLVTYPCSNGESVVVRVWPAELLDLPGGCGACPLAECNLAGDRRTGRAVCLRPARPR